MSQLRKFSENNWEKTLENMSSNPYKLPGILKSKPRVIPPLKTTGNLIAESPSDKANALALNYFHTMAPNPLPTSLHPKK